MSSRLALSALHMFVNRYAMCLLYFVTCKSFPISLSLLPKLFHTSINYKCFYLPKRECQVPPQNVGVKCLCPPDRGCQVFFVPIYVSAKCFYPQNLGASWFCPPKRGCQVFFVPINVSAKCFYPQNLGASWFCPPKTWMPSVFTPRNAAAVVKGLIGFPSARDTVS